MDLIMGCYGNRYRLPVERLPIMYNTQSSIFLSTEKKRGKKQDFVRTQNHPIKKISSSKPNVYKKRVSIHLLMKRSIYRKKASHRIIKSLDTYARREKLSQI